MNTLIQLLILALDIYMWIIFLAVTASWLVMFGVLNLRNKWIFKGYDLLNRATNPLMQRLRKFIPPLGGIDVTPIVVIIGIVLVRGMLIRLLYSGV